MANTTLTADVVAKAALAILENELGWVGKLHRAHEDEWGGKVNGYQKGETIRIRRPADFTVRDGRTASVQDVIEGYTSLAVDQMKGIDFKFTTQDLTLQVNDLSERVLKPAMSALVNEIASDVATEMYQGVYNWAGTAGQTINSFADFAKGPERLDEMTVPQEGRCGLLSPSDYWGLVGAQTSLYNGGMVSEAFKNGALSQIGNVETYMSAVTPTHSNGTADNTTPLVDGTGQTVTYDTAKNTWTSSLVTDGWDTSATITKGTVFTIAGVNMVNPKTKDDTGILQQFVVTAAVTANQTAANDTTLTISPPIITAGPHRTVSAAPGADATITVVGSASTGYKQNLVFHKNAMALAFVPLELPPGAYGAARESYKNISVRVVPYYAGASDESSWRLDVLYGRKLIDPRLATRLSGTS